MQARGSSLESLLVHREDTVGLEAGEGSWYLRVDNATERQGPL